MALTEEDKVWLQQILAAQESESDHKLAALETRFMASLERVETSLLTEFHKWASPVEARQKSHAAAIRALDEEMEALSDKVKNLEQRP